MDNIEIYTDASYDPRTKIAIYGDLTINDTGLSKIYYFNTNIIQNTTNTEGEIYGILNILGKVDPKNYLTVYTDCQMILKLVNSNERKSNKNIYHKFYDLYDKYQGRCKFIKVAGHKNKHMRSNIEDNFSKLDKHVRKELRLYLQKITI